MGDYHQVPPAPLPRWCQKRSGGEPGLLSLFQLLAHLCPHAASAQRDTQGVGGTGLLLSTRACVYAKSLRTCLTLCNPMDCSPEGSSVHPISQARILKWVAMPSLRGSNPCPSGLLHWQMGSLPLSHLGSPCQFWKNCSEKVGGRQLLSENLWDIGTLSTCLPCCPPPSLRGIGNWWYR